MGATGKRGPVRIIIVGAAGRDFHNFNTVFRDNPGYRVMAFTAAQILTVKRRYPASLAGKLYPKGIPIVEERLLEETIRQRAVDWVFFAYSDVSHETVMHVASRALSCGASFGLLGPQETMLRSRKPVIAVCAVRTGAGKSQTSRWIVRWLAERGHRVAVLRHPMPYGDLARQTVQRFATFADLEKAAVTIEEREEYEPYLRMGVPVFAGVDYQRILRLAERAADLILWDGGNNDFPFLRPDLHITVLNPHRAGHEMAYHPGETNFRMADAYVINKTASAPRGAVRRLREAIRSMKPDAPVVLADSAIAVDRPEAIRGKRVVVVGDGPTLTHGGMTFSAGTLAARRYKAKAIINPRRYAVGSLSDTFAAWPHLRMEVPAMGYSPGQVDDLEATLRRTPAETVVDATPVDLGRLLSLDKPIVSVEYELRPRGNTLAGVLECFVQKHLVPR